VKAGEPASGYVRTKAEGEYRAGIIRIELSEGFLILARAAGASHD
jgi:hypothetical protein